MSSDTSMGDAVRVAVLGPGDSPALRRLLALFGEAFADLETYTGCQPDEAYMERLLRSETFVCIGAFASDLVIGALAAYVLPKFEQVRSELYIYDLAVHEAFRRQGVATAMIDMLRELAASRGIYVIFVQADQGDEPAIHLYTKLGRREDVLHFDILPKGEA